ncbi:MAG: GC-type dockerin domain-anchored protein [Phycisphaerales bacterium JB040]
MRTDRTTLTVAGAALLCVAPLAPAQTAFDPAHPQGLELVGPAGDTVVLSPQHAGVLALADTPADGALPLRNQYGPWVVRFADGHWMDANTFGAGNPARTSSWSWDAGAGVLTYELVSTDAHAVEATYRVSAPAGGGFAFRLTLTNRSAFDLDVLSFPAHLAMPTADMDRALVPYIEGVELRPAFFETFETFGSGYPGAMYADYALFGVGGREAAVFFVHDERHLIPARWTINYDGPGNARTKVFHDFVSVVAPGETWTSPVMRVLPDTTVAASQGAYRSENGLGAHPTLADKLPASVRDRLAGAVLLKRDFYQGFQTFAGFRSYLDLLPHGNLLHPVVYWPNGFDNNYPDYLPTDPALGSTADFLALVRDAQANHGHLVMPYTNPTWWDDESPTIQTLGTGLVARDLAGSPIWETYPGNNSGYVVSPHHPDAIARHAQTLDEFTSTVPMDFLFEDQLGARGGLIDTNPAAPTRNAYTQGLVEVARRTSQQIPAWTEGGFDRLSPHEVGFSNSARVGWHPWADGTWRSYPLAPLWAREGLVFTAHNLAPYSMTNDHAALVEQLAGGYGLSYSIIPPHDRAWVDYLDAVQKRVVAPLFGIGMTDFVYDAEGVSTTLFDDGTVLVANRTGSMLARGDHTLSGEGFLITDACGFRGGRVTAVNGAALTGGVPHTIALTRSGSTLRIDHPEGPLTLLTLRDTCLGPVSEFVAVLSDGTQSPQAFTMGPGGLELLLLTGVDGRAVDHFLVRACRADVNRDGVLDNGDIGAFVTLFLAGDPAADFTGDGILDNGDIGAFVSAYLGGC